MQIDRDWRHFPSFNLEGRGLEIGALHEPFPTNPSTQMTYLDMVSRPELMQKYAGDRNVDVTRIPEIDVIGSAEKIPSEDQTFDFILASHVIEHTVNPGRAIEEWLRVVRTGGHIFMVVPDKRFSFDQHRQLTTLEHFSSDFMDRVERASLYHYLDYTEHVEWGYHHMIKYEDIPRRAQEKFEAQENTHFHVWTHETFTEHLDWLRHQLQGAFDIVDSAHYELNSCWLLRRDTDG